MVFIILPECDITTARWRQESSLRVCARALATGTFGGIFWYKKMLVYLLL
jgi:hypothetical protein